MYNFMDSYITVTKCGFILLLVLIAIRILVELSYITVIAGKRVFWIKNTLFMFSLGCSFYIGFLMVRDFTFQGSNFTSLLLFSLATLGLVIVLCRIFDYVLTNAKPLIVHRNSSYIYNVSMLAALFGLSLSDTNTTSIMSQEDEDFMLFQLSLYYLSDINRLNLEKILRIINKDIKPIITPVHSVSISDSSLHSRLTRIISTTNIKDIFHYLIDLTNYDKVSDERILNIFERQINTGELSANSLDTMRAKLIKTDDYYARCNKLLGNVLDRVLQGYKLNS